MNRETTSIQEGSQCRDNEPKTRLAGIGEKTCQPQVPSDHSPNDTERNYEETSVMETV